jgi:hypothetical protein
VDKDGRAFRISLGEDYWDLAGGGLGEGVALLDGEEGFRATASTSLRISEIQLSTRLLANGENGYPRWDGGAWLLVLGGPEEPARETAGGRGRLYLRNLSRATLSIAILGAEGRRMGDSSWGFGPLEGADDLFGKFLTLSEQGPLIVGPEARVDINLADGTRRVLALARHAEWRESGSWLLSLAPELLAGEGPLLVKNLGEEELEVRLLGSEGSSLYGDLPWVMEAGEGSELDRGTALLHEGEELVFTGRETVSVGTRGFRLLYEGRLGDFASRRGGDWILELERAGK